jgi:hypothetical protein
LVRQPGGDDALDGSEDDSPEVTIAQNAVSQSSLRGGRTEPLVMSSCDQLPLTVSQMP